MLTIVTSCVSVIIPTITDLSNDLSVLGYESCIYETISHSEPS